MGDLMDRVDDIPVKHFSANATDFSTGLPFRFQVTETRMTEKTRSAFGIFGNNEHRLGQDIARQITLGEALACSSCFPSGFEPMVFPDDFKVYQKENAAKIDSFGIMDGGIVDNQGIEPIL
jgi:predicted acylesterase/phospholipase RssA